MSRSTTSLEASPTGDRATAAALYRLLSSLSGFTVVHEAIEKAASGSPVSADLEARSAGVKMLFEIKIDEPTTYLPMSACAQLLRLKSTGAEAALVTNMKVESPVSTLLREAGIPVLLTPVPSDSNALFAWVKDQSGVNQRVYSIFEHATPRDQQQNELGNSNLAPIRPTGYFTDCYSKADAEESNRLGARSTRKIVK